MPDYPGFAGMEVVTREDVGAGGAIAVPGVCVLTQDAEGPFLNTGTKLYASHLDTHILVHVQKVKDMGRAVGMVPQEDLERVQEQLDAHEAKVRELEALVDAYTTIKEAEKELSLA